MSAQDASHHVMILSAAAGAGHISAAEALLSAFEAKEAVSRHIEVLRYTPPMFQKLYADLYLTLVNQRPEVLGWVYDTLDQPWKFQKRRLALDRVNTGRLIRLIKNERPGLALCTHFLPAEILAYLRTKGEVDIPFGVVVTDFDAHAMWLYRGASWYFVACEETKVYLTELGIPAETIHVTGIPVHPAFAVPRPKMETRKRLGLDPDLTTLIVVAGGFGVGPVEAIVHGVRNVEHPVQVVVICGKNAKLEERLKSLPGKGNPLKVVGYTRDMEVWMAAADLYIGKAGGLSASEALARGLILVIVNPIPGQEERNSDHFLEEGVAIRCNNLPALSYKIDTLLGDPGRMARMKEAVRRLAHPTAAADIVSIVLGG